MNAVPVNAIAAEAGRSVSRVWQVMRGLKVKPTFKKVRSTDDRMHRMALLTSGQASAVLNRLKRTIDPAPAPVAKQNSVPAWQKTLLDAAKGVPPEYTRIVIEVGSGVVIVTRMVEERLAPPAY